MVEAVRAGEGVRAVARRLGVSPGAVLYWAKRSAGTRVDRFDFEDRARGPRRPWNRTASQTEQRVLSMRRDLRTEDILGEFGAPAIHRAMLERGEPSTPSPATIGRILKRHGAIDAWRRQRRPAPRRGWYLPAVATGQAELDSLDLIEELKLQGGPQFSVLTAISLHGHCADAWPRISVGARDVGDCLIARWRALGLPHFAQFDNDTRFQGAHQFADTVGRVSRLCLSLGVIPVFATPLEHGFQNAIESFNGLWQAKVWQRFHFCDLPALQAHSERYIRMHRQRNASNEESAPARGPFPEGWHFDLDAPLTGTLIYLRRTNARGELTLLGHRWAVDPHWVHRLVRCEVHLSQQRILCFALRRRDPADQPLLAEIQYQRPNKPFKGSK